MKKKLLLAAVIATLFSGCVIEIGSQRSGVEVPDEKMNRIVINKSTQADVERIIGQAPTTKERFGTSNGSTEIWQYRYTILRPLDKNENRYTIFEFNDNGVVTKKYRKNEIAP